VSHGGIAHAQNAEIGFSPWLVRNSCLNHSRWRSIDGSHLAMDRSFRSTQMPTAPIWVAAWKSPTSEADRAVHRVVSD
jgi:hypothetical protein